MPKSSDRREFLMLAKPSKGTEDIGGWYWSEKLDGFRCMWDGGVSRDVQIGEVPWANLSQGDTALATGLWSRYGNPIYAPDWFLNALPVCPLDGELFGGRGNFQKTMSTCKKKIPIDSEWRDINYMVFSTPQLQNLFQSGQIKVRGFERYIFMDKCEYFYSDYACEELHHLVTGNGTNVVFEFELQFLQSWLEGCEPVLFLHPQLKLPIDKEEAWKVVNEKTRKVVELGGEGGVIRNPHAHWAPKRVSDVLKVKPTLDSEATIVGATSGNVGKTGKYHGLVGNFIMKWNDGTIFELSGFTDAERALCGKAKDWALDNPGKEVPLRILNGNIANFELGDRLTFTYREKTDDGKPKEARFLRMRPEE